MIKCNSPLNVQFEVTYQCNNRCIFCYNKNYDIQPNELDTEAAKRIIRNISDSGVLSLNFNGGEPLMRADFFELAAYAKSFGLDVHLNTNANLIDDSCARQIVAYFPAVCTTILSGDKENHDSLSGRPGALEQALAGIESLQHHGVYVAVNVMLCSHNIVDFDVTLDLIRRSKIRSLLVTRYVPNSYQDPLNISDAQFFEVIQAIDAYQKKHICFERISLPQPIQICSAPATISDLLSHWNIPCNIGLCTASIDAFGQVTPCNLVKEPVLGNGVKESLVDIWDRFDGLNYCRHEHLLPACSCCTKLGQCGGGCKGYLSVFRANNEKRDNS